MRDAEIKGANFKGSIFLTQVQINSANGDRHTKLPSSLSIGWVNHGTAIIV